MTARERPAVPAPVVRAVVYLVLAIPLLVRLNTLRQSVAADGPGSYLRLTALELPLLVCLIALVEWVRRLPTPLTRLPVLAAAVGMWTILMADALVFQMFGLRLTIPDVVRYGTRVADVVAFIDLRVALPLLATAALLSIAAVARGTRKAIAGASRRSSGVPPGAVLPVVALASLLLASTFAPRDDGDLHGWMFQNLVSLHTQNSLYAGYGATFTDSVRAATGESVACVTTGEAAEHPDVVVVMLESFSSGFSPLYGGSRSHLPELDRISSDGLRFTRFLANGFTTEHGLISILGATLPVFPVAADARTVAGYMAFEGFYGLTDSLPRCAAGLGYHTEFLTSGDLSFTNKGDWLRSIGFARVEGHDAPLYAGLPRGMFRAVTDSVLYDRALRRITELRADARPFVLVLEGVDSHGPYRGRGGLAAVLEAADASLGGFYDGLAGADFLDDGLLVLVSDHRVQVALTAEERSSFGSEAAARVPAAIVGRGVEPGEDSVPRHQVDVLPTLIHLVTGQARGSSLAGSLFDMPPDRCIPWLHGGRRDEIVALCGDDVVRIRLDGEATRVVAGEPSVESDSLIAAIHRARILGSDPGRWAASH